MEQQQDESAGDAEARNPDSVELRFYLGRHLYDRGKGDLTAAGRTFAEARGVAHRKCGGDFFRLTDKESESLASVLDYLSALATLAASLRSGAC